MALASAQPFAALPPFVDGRKVLASPDLPVTRPQHRHHSSRQQTAGGSASSSSSFSAGGRRSSSKLAARGGEGADQSAKDNVNVAVVGAGPVGLFVALALCKRGFRKIRVFDRLPKPPAPDADDWGDCERSYNLGIGGRGQRALKRFGAFERVDRWCRTVVGRREWPADGSEPKVTINTGRRFMTRVLARDRLSSCIYEELQQKYPDVQVDFETECAGIDFRQNDEQNSSTKLTMQRCSKDALAAAKKDGAARDELAEEGCEVESGRAFDFDADVVVGADGVRSSVREAMAEAGVDVQATRYADRRPTVYKTLPINMPEGHRVDLNYSTRNKGVTIEALPNLEGALGGVVLFSPDDKRVTELKDGADARKLFEELFPNWPLPYMSDKALDDFAKAPIRQLPQFSHAGPDLNLAGKAVLLGDAIHSVKPYFGLGVNSGFEDVAVLDNCLSETGGDVEAAFKL
eukprot:TRINITY_DN10877_c0_g1_i1.p1 TRINITY_DN10877_c0_g1~~TRINITY_DN10877_c0_g1_i1.p1  ORF type:complete len:488 (-),score=121.50 TRINITY_DN10877_c0_g1_i1:124-1506(-)